VAPEGLSVQPAQVADGGLARIRLKMSEAVTAVRGRIDKGEFEFYPLATGDAAPSVLFEALLGVPFGREPGSYPVSVEVTLAEGGKRELALQIPVISGNYASETLSVDPRHVKPDAAALKRIQKESAEIGRIYRKPRKAREWSGAFALPIQSPITSPFGTKRIFNGDMKSFHQGLDLKAAIGTPIQSPAGGTVVLAKDLYMTGNTVILDHGFGLFTVYAHMSEFSVKPGEAVLKGTVLGLSGMTGRASGPHLHWGAVVHRAKVNPLDLVQLLKE